MRVSHLFSQTLREIPVESETASHQLLVRAGYHPAVGCGHFQLPAAGAAQPGKDHGHHARRNECHRRTGDLHAGGTACRCVEGNRTVLSNRQRDGTFQGQARPRHGAGHDPRRGGG